MPQHLPFRVDHGASTDLTEQIEKGLEGAIRTGVFLPGERLPGIRDMARELGVSNVVVSRAVRRLSGAGRVSARPRAGIRVAKADQAIWRGHVLMVDASGGSHYFGARAEALTAELQAANLQVSVIHHVNCHGDRTLARVETALASMSVSLVLLAVSVPGVVEACERHGLPYVSMKQPGASTGGPQGRLIFEQAEAMAAFAEHVRGLNVTHVHGILIHPEQALALRQALAPIGLEPTLEPPLSWDEYEGSEGIEYVAFKATQRMLARGSLPELLFLPDDFMLRGAMTALLLAGKRVPLDIQVVGMVNRGACPIYPVPFTRIEHDPASHGRMLAELVLACLEQDPGEPPIALTLSPRFVAGATTCPLAAPHP